MAGVTTWADFVTELTTNHTVALGDNIDLYDDYPYGVDPISLDANTRYEIDGAGYEIRNLKNKPSASLAIFNAASSGTEIYMENIDFRNLITQGVNFISNASGAVNGSTGKYPVEFMNCRFAGERSGTSYLVTCSHIKATSTYFSMPWMALNVDSMEYCSLVSPLTNNATDYIADYCRFHEHYGGWIPKTWDSRPLTKKVPWGCYMFKKSGCRVEGDMIVADGSDVVTVDLMLHNNVSSQPSVMNVADIKIKSTNQNVKGAYGNWFGLYVDNVKNANDETMTSWVAVSNITTSAYTPLIATPEEAASQTWLYEHGFDV